MPPGPRRALHLLLQLLPRARPHPREDRTVRCRTAGAPRVVASSLDRQPAIAVVTAAPTDAFVRDRPDLCVLERPRAAHLRSYSGVRRHRSAGMAGRRLRAI